MTSSPLREWFDNLKPGDQVLVKVPYGHGGDRIETVESRTAKRVRVNGRDYHCGTYGVTKWGGPGISEIHPLVDETRERIEAVERLEKAIHNAPRNTFGYPEWARLLTPEQMNEAAEHLEAATRIIKGE